MPQNYMTMKEVDNLLNNEEYVEWLQQLVQKFRNSQIKASLKVNDVLLRYYWNLGKDIAEKKAESRWGEGFFKRLSYDLRKKLPDVKGFSVTNLTYIKYFYTAYNQCFTIYPQLGDKLETAIYSIPWGHHKILLDNFKQAPEKLVFFVQKVLENGWSRALLENFVKTDLYERSGKAITNFKTTLPDPDSSIAQNVLKDPYNFDFLTLTEDYKEQDLQKALEQNIYRFLLELGNGFAFVGRQVRLEVNGDEFFCDLLFYHIKLKRYVVCELKTVKFQPEFISKLNFYCTAVNHLIKGNDDNDTIGLLICKEKNDLVAQWTVEKNQRQPLGISSYELTKLYPKEISQTLPSIEDIEKELKDKP